MITGNPIDEGDVGCELDSIRDQLQALADIFRYGRIYDGSTEIPEGNLYGIGAILGRISQDVETTNRAISGREVQP